MAEVQLKAVTREKVKSGFNYQFDAMREFGEKLAIIAGYGKHLLELIEEPAAMPREGVQRTAPTMPVQRMWSPAGTSTYLQPPAHRRF